MSGSSAFDHQFKFCLVGPSRVGKTSIKVRATDFIFSESYLATIGPEFVEIIKNHDLTKKVIKVTLWDGPGKEKYITEVKRNAIMKNCQGVLLVFDLSRRETFEEMEHFWTLLMEKSPNANVVLVGNKSDLVQQREVSEEEGLALSARLCCDLYIEVSAATGAGFPEVMTYLEGACLGKVMRNGDSWSSGVSNKRSPDPTVVSGTNASESMYGRSLATTQHSRSALGMWYPIQEERDAALEEFNSALKEGVQVLVYPHEGGAPDYANLFMDRTSKRIMWAAESGAVEGLYLHDIAEIRPPTENAYTFQKMRVPHSCEGKYCLFTIIGSQKAVSMGAKSLSQCKFLVRGLKLLAECSISPATKKMRGKEQWTQGRFMILRGGRLTNADQMGLEEFKSLLNRGVEIMLMSKGSNRRDPKILWMDNSHNRINVDTHRFDKSDGISFFTALWRAFSSPQRGINMDDISEIRPGFGSFLFSSQEPPPHPKEEALAVSIIGSECTLSMLMSSPHERDLLVSHFQGLLRVVRPTVSVY